MADPLGPSILTVLFLVLSALVYALNAALPAADSGAMRQDAEQGSSHAARVLKLLDRFNNGYGEIRMTYVLLFSAAFASLRSFLVPLLTQALPVSAPLCTSLLLFIYGILAFTLTAIIPGSIATHAPEKTLQVVAAPANLIITALSLITAPAYWLGGLILRPFRIEPRVTAEHVTEEEIRMMVDIGEEKGAIEADEKEMIENIFEFNNMDAADCMVHRKDVTAIDITATDEEIFSTITESGFSRFPVYEDSIDNIIGILTARDFLTSRYQDSSKPLRELIRQPHFVPESVRTDVLFREMQTGKQHMAIVIDEYGGTGGLITLEDLLEEIVGNIYDEYDDPVEDQTIIPLPDACWRVAGSAELEQLAEALNVELPLDEEYDTLGGLVFSQLTEIPADGEKPEVEVFGLHISVTEIADRRVEWAIVRILPKKDDENEENDGADR